MLDIPQNIKELFWADNTNVRTAKRLKLRFYDEDISLLFPSDSCFPSDDLFPIDMEPILLIENDCISEESLTLTESICESGDLTFGECNASKLEIIVADVIMDVTGKEFIMSLEVNGYEFAMGIYRVESFIRQADRRMRKITAYDRMRNFQRDVAAWYQKLIFPITLKEMRDSLCAYTNLEQVDTTLPLDNLQITKTIDPQQLSGLDVLQAICEINGCFGHIDKTGRLKYITLAVSSLYPSDELYPAENLYPEEMLNAENILHYKPSETTYEDYIVYGIERVTIKQEEGDVGASYGPEGNTYTIEGNFLVYGKSSNELLQIAAAVHNEISGRIYRPCKIGTPALPWIEPGDGLICYTSDDAIETYCLKRTIKGIQAMSDTFEADGSQKIEESFGIQTQIIQLEGKTAIIKKTVEEVSVNVTDLKEYTEAQFKITADSIIQEVKRAQETEEKLSASIKVNAEEIAIKVSKGEVSSQLSVESGQVTISGNRLIVDSTNFKLDGNGNAVFSGTITGSTINTANGKFTVDANGNITLKGATFDGCINTGSMGADVINANYGRFGDLEVNDQCTLQEVVANDIYCDDIQCTQIYSKTAGEWWSDRRLKHDIEPIEPEKALKIINTLNPCIFIINGTDTKNMGFIAQEVAALESDLPLYGKKDKYFTIPYISYIALLTGAIQAQQKEINLIKNNLTRSI